MTLRRRTPSQTIVRRPVRRCRSKPAAATVEPTVRSEFADTALWVASLDTNADGLAEVALDMPENLTDLENPRLGAWATARASAKRRAKSSPARTSSSACRRRGSSSRRDEVVLSANVHNYLAEAKQVKVRLEQTGNTLELPADVEQTDRIPAGGERRVDWRVKAAHEGEAVHPHVGPHRRRIRRRRNEASPSTSTACSRWTATAACSARPTSAARSKSPCPSERRAEQTRLEVRYSPTLAGAMVDALPYLVDYPYGCTEQTLNRFLPAVITQQTLQQHGRSI